MQNETETEHSKLFAPFTSPPEEWRNANDYQFVAFILHSHEDRCLCGSINRYGNVYRAFVTKSAISSPSNNISRRLVAFSSKLPANVSVIRFNLPPRTVPICPHCLETTREGSATLLVTDEAAWNLAIQREKELRAIEAKSKPREPKEKTIFSLSDIPG